MNIRSILSCSLLAASLASATACKKHELDNDNSDMRHAEAKVNEKNAELVKAEDKANLDVAKEQTKVDVAKIDLQKVQAEYAADVNARLAKIDAKLNLLAVKTDADSKDKLAKLQARRAALASTVGQMSTQPDDHWDAYKKSLDDSFDALDKDLDDATK